MKHWLELLLLLVIALPGDLGRGETVGGANESAEPDVLGPHQWRCIWTEDPATSARIAWNTATSGGQHRLHLRRTDNAQAAAEDVQIIEAERNGRYSSNEEELFYHHVRLRALSPATTYYLTLESDGRRSPDLYFTTAPAEDVPLSILFGADSRSGLAERRQMNAMISRMVVESREANRPPIVALAHGGDYIRDGDVLSQWSQWMTDHNLTDGPDGRLLPIIPARGNHDHGEIFNEIFGFPPDDHNYYAIDIGPQLRWITLNTEVSVAGRQSKWLAGELAASRPRNRWLAAQYHRPAFPAVKIPGRALVHWVPLFEKYHVDLVCEGDGHNIKRTAPIRNNIQDPTGVVYVGEGGLGVGQRTPDADRWYLRPPHGKTGRGHHVQMLTFDKQHITYRAVVLDEGVGKIFDEHRLAVRPAELREGEF